MSGPEWSSFEDAVRYARGNLNEPRRMSRVQGFITGGWWPPEPEAQRRLHDFTVAVLAEANKRGATDSADSPRERSGKASFL